MPLRARSRVEYTIRLSHSLLRTAKNNSASVMLTDHGSLNWTLESDSGEGVTEHAREAWWRASWKDRRSSGTTIFEVQIADYWAQRFVGARRL